MHGNACHGVRRLEGPRQFLARLGGWQALPIFGRHPLARVATTHGCAIGHWLRRVPMTAQPRLAPEVWRWCPRSPLRPRPRPAGGCRQGQAGRESRRLAWVRSYGHDEHGLISASRKVGDDALTPLEVFGQDYGRRLSLPFNFKARRIIAQGCCSGDSVSEAVFVCVSHRGAEFTSRQVIRPPAAAAETLKGFPAGRQGGHKQPAENCRELISGRQVMLHSIS